MHFCVLVIILLVNLSYPSASCAHELSSGYMNVVEQNGISIFQTGHEVHPGDEFIDEENRLYEITSVEGTLARARFVRNELVSLESGAEAIAVQAPANSQSQLLIAVYHTHTDESYIPTDGQATQNGKGSIMKVGQEFAKQLDQLGYQTIHSTTLHDPHDANAYHRSRRTVIQLLQKKPAALFDIHRDSAPLNVYRTVINGQEAAKLLLVVGRQNQNRTTTLNYAKKIKAAADSKYKGLVRGIFIAHGNYNQDLQPRALLVEVGTQYNSLAAAQRSVALFADVVPLILQPRKPKPPGQQPIANQDDAEEADIEVPEEPVSYSYDILSIAVVLLTGAFAFLFLSTGSWQEAKNKLSQLKNKEFGDLLRFFKRQKE